MDIKILLSNFSNQFTEFDFNTSVDCAIFTIKNDALKVLLTRFVDDIRWMLPGGFIGKKEDTDVAARRILQERTGVENNYLQQFKVFADPERFSFGELLNGVEPGENTMVFEKLPERVISIGYFALVNYEKLKLTGGIYREESKWTNISELPQLAFDHNQIIFEAVKALRKELHLKPIGYNLLPEKFTMPELQRLYEIVLDRKIDRSSFQRKMLNWNIYERLEERKEGVAHKRPFLYKFNLVRYEQARERGLNFGI